MSPRATVVNDPPPEELLRTERAYHEAGHAIAAHRLGEVVVGLTIEKDGSFNEALFEAYTHVDWDLHKAEHDPIAFLRRGMVIALAGGLAEEMAGRQIPLWEQAGNPLNHAEAAMVFCETVTRHDGSGEALFETMLSEAQGLIADEVGWDAFVALANELADSGRLDGDRVRQVLAEHGLI